MEIRADLHNHAYERQHCPTSAKHILEIAEQRLGPNGVFGIANSQWGKTFDRKPDYDYRYELFFKTCLKEFGYRKIEVNGPSIDKSNMFHVNPYGVHILKTQEMEFPEGHILVLGLPYGTNLKQRKITESLRETKAKGCPAEASHIFFMSKLGDYLLKNPEILDFFSAIMVHDGEAIVGNKKAQKFYKKFCENKNIGALSSSDAHSPFEIGRSYSVLSEIDCNQNPEKLNKSLDEKIREHNDWLNDKQEISYSGFTKHAFYFALRLGLSKMRINLS